MVVEPPNAVAVRRATADDRDAVLNVLDGANLETDHDAVAAAIERGAVLVAESTRGADGGTPTVVGALALAGDEITHVAVRRRRRGQGIGTALVETAATDRDRLTARFDAEVRPFYETLGFEIEPAEEAGRYVGRRPSDERFDEVPTGGE